VPPRSRPPLSAFDAPLPTSAERRANGKSMRDSTPRTSHSFWEPSADRVDPIELLVESNRTRLADLVPLRYARMAVSPFTFLRGSALAMAYDLAHTPSSGETVRLCGDAHVSNVGVFASPERRMTFDLNDFDETHPGPFEWDVKRMAASIAVAARGKGMTQQHANDAVKGCVNAYRDWMSRYADMTQLEVWYARIEVRDIMERLDSEARKVTEAGLQKSEGKNNLKALAKLTEVVHGRRRIISDPPLVERFEGDGIRERLEDVLSQYRMSLSADRQALFDRYRFVDFARKVVGVGSVGTRCWIALFQGPNGGPLFLQLKEARESAPQLALGEKPPKHQGQRVVEGQRMLQATSDVLLGWGRDHTSGIDYYARQLWDMKGSFDVTAMRPDRFLTYTWFCGWALARAHARTGDSPAIAGYLGKGDTFATAIAEFAQRYADQTERDHAALVAALERGVLPSTPLV
jgi:uncharacterized protein (DUF2252 family)